MSVHHPISVSSLIQCLYSRGECERMQACSLQIQNLNLSPNLMLHPSFFSHLYITHKPKDHMSSVYKLENMAVLKKSFISLLPSRLQIVFLVTTFTLLILRSFAQVQVVGGHRDFVDHWTNDLDVVGDEEWDMVGRKGNQFMVGGQPFYVNGFNTYWLMIFAVDPSTRGKITDVFQEASSVGLTVCRTWAFNDGGWRALQKSPSIYDEEVFKALDFVVSEARKYKIRLVLTLTNNWEAYGGKAQYVKWGKEAGMNLTSDEDFFSDPTIKGYYKAHVKNVLTRVNTLTNVTYKDDPTIFAWELMNEPRCLSDPSGNKLQEWIQEMAFHVKSIDPHHLVEIGVEGFYGPSSPDRLQFNPNSFAGQVGTDFIRNHQVLGIDFASVHMYPDSWLSNSTPEAQFQFLNSWMQAHIDDAEAELGMPVVFGEFGVSAKDTRFNETFRAEFFDAVFRIQLNSTRKGGSGGGCLFWQLFPEGTENMDDGYAVVLSKAPVTSNLLSLHSKRLQTFNSRCTWRCHWGCKKRVPMDVFHSHDEL